MNVVTQDALNKAFELGKKRENLDEQIDAILTPIIVNAMHTMDNNDLTELMTALPQGFHRSELRQFINQRQLSSVGEKNIMGRIISESVNHYPNLHQAALMARIQNLDSLALVGVIELLSLLDFNHPHYLTVKQRHQELFVAANRAEKKIDQLT